MSRIYLAYRSKNNAFAPYKRFAQQNLGGGRIHFARALKSFPGTQAGPGPFGQAKRKCGLSVRSSFRQKHSWPFSSWTRSKFVFQKMGAGARNAHQLPKFLYWTARPELSSRVGLGVIGQPQQVVNAGVKVEGQLL